MDSMVAATCAGLTPGGVDSRRTSSDSLKSGQAPRTIASTTKRLTNGSRTDQPVSMMAPPLTTTPKETQASLSMCQKALRILRSSFAPCWSRSAIDRLATKLMRAMSMTQPPGIGTGVRMRWALMIVMPTAVSSRIKELRNAATMPAR